MPTNVKFIISILLQFGAKKREVHFNFTKIKHKNKKKTSIKVKQTSIILVKVKSNAYNNVQFGWIKNK